MVVAGGRIAGPSGPVPHQLVHGVPGRHFGDADGEHAVGVVQQAVTVALAMVFGMRSPKPLGWRSTRSPTPRLRARVPSDHAASA